MGYNAFQIAFQLYLDIGLISALEIYKHWRLGSNLSFFSEPY